MARGDGHAPSTRRPSSSTLATPLGGFLEAATQPIAPAPPARRRRPGRPARRSVRATSGRLRLVPGHGPRCRPRGPGAGRPGRRRTGRRRARRRHAGPDGFARDAGAVAAGRRADAVSRRHRVPLLRRRRGPRRGLRCRRARRGLGLAPADAAALADDARRRASSATRPRRSSAVILNLRAGAPGVPRRRGPAGAPRRDRPRRASSGRVLARSATRADSPIPPTSWAFDAATSVPVDFDPEAARAGLVAAGWKEAESGGWIAKGQSEALTIELLSPEESANPASFAVAEAVAADWRAIGLTVVHTPLTADRARRRPPPGGGVLGGRRRHGHRPRPGPLPAPRLEPGDRRAARTSPGSRTRPSTRSSSAARAPGTDEARKAAYVALQARLATGVYLLPIAFRDEVVVVRDTLRGPRHPAHREPRGPILGCANMAPRRRPVSTREPARWVRAEVAERQTR